MEDPVGPRDLERFRDYLHALARMHLDARLQGKLDPADIVQDAFAEALLKWEQFRGGDESRLKAWLRQVLLHNLLDCIRHWKTKKSDAALEVALEHSSVCILGSLAAEQSSPSEHACRQEQMGRVADALLLLPEDQREAVLLNHYQGLRVAEVASRLGRSRAATAGLIHRGLTRLRHHLQESDSS
jgi:RNA polymerase sigma-70 factor (ECF subfamily)